MLISSSKDRNSVRGVSERDLRLADALSYVESLEATIAERYLAKRLQTNPDTKSDESGDTAERINA